MTLFYTNNVYVSGYFCGEANLSGFLLFVYICIAVGDAKLGTGFPLRYVLFFVFSDLRRETFDRLVESGTVIGNHFLIFLIIIND